MTWKVFKETGVRTKEFISITETKAFGLSRAFLDGQGITKDYKAVVLFEEESREIALHFTLADTKIGFAVRFTNPKHGATVVARSFFDMEKLDARKYAGRYDAFEKKSLKDLGIDKEGDAFVFKLKENSRKDVAEMPSLQYDEKEDSPINLDDIPF